QFSCFCYSHRLRLKKSPVPHAGANGRVRQSVAHGFPQAAFRFGFLQLGTTPMSWTVEHCQGLLERYWRDGIAACPTCSSVVRVTYLPFTIDYVLAAVCPNGC